MNVVLYTSMISECINEKDSIKIVKHLKRLHISLYIIHTMPDPMNQTAVKTVHTHNLAKHNSQKRLLHILVGNWLEFMMHL